MTWYEKIPPFTNFTLANVRLQWIAVKGIVLDVTNWLDEHPGGPQALFSHMGKDASEGKPPYSFADFGLVANVV
jgi:cytochrome b involved in lipid metabolism